MAATIFILNGPNLNMLGKREPALYGTGTLADIEAMCAARAKDLGIRIDFRQDNREGILVDWLQEAGDKAAGVVLNAGAYTHTSVAIHDAIRGTGLPVIEVHLSNIFARESFRHHSFVSPVAKGMICGLGPQGYVLALEALATIIAANSSAKNAKDKKS
ncbi:MAG TPA: type II 3-dehydroquinate dehydratase [Bauldia sp.]|nr:type II 3-dehydroquinate dehydratase [Bauldia sp.]